VLRAEAESDGERFATGYQLVDYEHIRPQRLYRPAETAIEAVDVALPPRAQRRLRPGRGDNVAPMLAQLGLPVTTLDPAASPPPTCRASRRSSSARARTRRSPALATHNARLLDWARAGGTLVVQYGTVRDDAAGRDAVPRHARPPGAARDDRGGAGAPLAAAARVLAAPNRIGAADWNGWVQERATYMPQTADAAYQPVVDRTTPASRPTANALLVAPLGRGTYVYTTLALFRQLPPACPARRGCS
jgi:hypothetical protein